VRARIGFLSAVLLALALPSGALGASKLDELLEQTKTARAREAQANAKRVEQFRAERDQQAKRMAEALAARNAAEARSQQLSAQYDANEKTIAELGALLRQREGNLGELFGVTRQVAGDTANVLSQSMVSVHYPDRVEFLRTLAGAKALPSIEELERLWIEMQQEMTETGRVARFQTKVVQPKGESVDAEVVRIGPFIAMTDGEYLAYRPASNALALLPRQPPGEFTSAAEDLFDAESGYVEAVADPGRGGLLGLYVERPTLLERIQAGEFVGYVIILVGIVGALLAAYQFVYLVNTRRSVSQQLQSLDRPTADNPLGRVLLAFRGDPGRIEEEAEVAELRISEAVLREVPRLERFQAFLRLAVAAGPLLGLIGTVIGMIITFQSITESGSSDPKLMAEGIGQAMIATVLGLGIAIPLLFVNAGLSALSRQVVQVLDEQSTGLLAESIESRRAAR
jgi:biopolymer transport protein ExbB